MAQQMIHFIEAYGKWSTGFSLTPECIQSNFVLLPTAGQSWTECTQGKSCGPFLMGFNEMYHLLCHFWSLPFRS